MKRRIIGLVLISAWLAGCAPAPQRIEVSERKAIGSVGISAAVVKPPAPFYLGPGGAFGLMFGAIGALATEAARTDGRAALVEFAQKNGIAIERIVLEEFTQTLRASVRSTPPPSPAAVDELSSSAPNATSGKASCWRRAAARWTREARPCCRGS